MENINYQKYDVNRILSVNRNPNKENAALVNNKYFFQIKNKFEEDLEEEEEAYPFYEFEQLTEQGEYAQVNSLEDLCKLCALFQLEDEITYILIFQFLKFVRMDSQWIKPKEEQPLNDDSFIYQKNRANKSIAEFIYQHGIQYILKQLDFSRSFNFKEMIEEQFRKYFLVHPSIVEVQFGLPNMFEMENLILAKKSSDISKEDQKEFLNWMSLISTTDFEYNNIFDCCYDLNEDDVWDSQKVLNDLQKKINKIIIGEDFISALLYQNPITVSSLKQVLKNFERQSDKTGFDISLLQEFEEKADLIVKRNLIYVKENPLIPLSSENLHEDKVVLEVRKKKDKYRFATKSWNIVGVGYLFNVNHESIHIQSDKNLQYIEKEFYRTDNNITLLSLDIEKFCLNVDYDIVERLLNLQDIADHLRRRKVIFLDPTSKTKEEFKMKKGILIGEPFHNVITNSLSGLIKALLDQVMKIYFEEFDLYNNVDDFLFIIRHDKDDSTYENKKSILTKLQKFLKYAELLLMNLGFCFNQEKIKILDKGNGNLEAWQLSKEFQLIETDEFKIFGKDFMILSQQERCSKPKKEYIFTLMYQVDSYNPIFNQITDNELDQIFQQYSAIEQCFIIKFILDCRRLEIYFNRSQLNEINAYLKHKLGLSKPFAFIKQISYW